LKKKRIYTSRFRARSFALQQMKSTKYIYRNSVPFRISMCVCACVYTQDICVIMRKREYI